MDKRLRSSQKLVKGEIYKLVWKDAVFYPDADSVNVKHFENGGESLTAVGYLVNHNENSVLLCAELDGEMKPNRDFNLIPKVLIVSMVRLTTSSKKGKVNS
jgi:hypothetical protein